MNNKDVRLQTQPYFPEIAWNRFSSISCDVTKFCHGGIPTFLRDVLTKHGTCNCKTAYCHNTSCSSSHLCSSAPTTLLLLFLCCRSRRSRSGPWWCGRIWNWSGQVLILWNWDQHGCSNLGLFWHVHRNELAFLCRMRHMNACAWGARRHLDAEGWAGINNGFRWLLPFVWGTNLARLSTAHILLAHGLEVHFILLASQLVFGMRKTRKVGPFQDLVLIARIVLSDKYATGEELQCLIV